MKTPDSTPPSSLTGFEVFGLRPELLQTLAELGYEEPTPVQRAAIPPQMEGKDVVAQAATGTGKTAAFAIPLLQNLSPGASGPFETSALVLVPTRELAMQVAEAIFKYGKILGATVLPVYGGQEMGPQLQKLKRGVDIVVATPGRALDHMRRKSLLLGKVKRVVLDEADEMLDMGFAEDLEAILSALPADRQTALFSATLPSRIASIAERHLRQPTRLKLAKEKTAPGEAPKVRQTVYLVPRGGKDDALGRILDLEAPTRTIVFCRTRNEVDALSETLQGHGLRASALHGGMSQEQRDRVMRRFKSKEVELLVATDVAARGLDIDHLSHVVNYDLPTSPEVYVHRIGRTGRAGREGVAITLAEPREARLLTTIERTTGQKIGRATLPTDNDVRTRRLELTRSAVKSALELGGLDDYRAVAASLMAEFPSADVAAAALKLLHETSAPPPRAPSSSKTSAPAGRERVDRPERSERSGRPERPERSGRPERMDRGGRPERSEGPERAERNERPEQSERPEQTERSARPESTKRLERPDVRPDIGRRLDRSEKFDRSSARPASSETPERAPARAEDSDSDAASGPSEHQRPKPVSRADTLAARPAPSPTFAPRAKTERSERPSAPARAERSAPTSDRPVRLDRPTARDDRGAAPKRFDRADKHPGKNDRPDQPSPRVYRPERATDLTTGRERTGAYERAAAPARGRKDAASSQIFIGLGRRAGVRPADLVGALINEVGLERAQVGAVAIEEAHTLVEVPSHRAKDVVEALREMHIRGRKVFARIQTNSVTDRV